MKKTLKRIVGIAISAVIAFSAVGAPASFADGGGNIGKSEQMPQSLLDYVEEIIPGLALSVSSEYTGDTEKYIITNFLKIYDENGAPTERWISYIVADYSIIGDIVVGIDDRGLPCASGGLCEYPEINEAFRAGESAAFLCVDECFLMYCDGNWTDIYGHGYLNSEENKAKLKDLEGKAKDKSKIIACRNSGDSAYAAAAAYADAKHTLRLIGCFASAAKVTCSPVTASDVYNAAAKGSLYDDEEDDGDECVYTIRLSDEYLECFRENKNAVLSFKYEEYPGHVIEDNELSILFYFKDGKTDNCPIFITPGMDLRGWEAISVSKILRRAGIADPENIEKIVIYQIDSDACRISMTECGIHTGPCWIRPNSNYYYVKENGKLAVKSTTIDGIRYTFDKFGVCTGRYTGWTKSDNGRRYWRNGVLVKNRQFTSPNGKKYSADAEGNVSAVS